MIDPSTKLWSQPKAIRAFLANDWSAPPVNVEIAPTHRCNANCPWCFYTRRDGTRKQSGDDLPWTLLRRCLDDLALLGVKAVTWTGGGEPCVYPDLARAIEHVARRGLRQGLFTNGYQLVDHAERLAWVRISITDRLTVPPITGQYAGNTHTGVVVNVTPENVGELRRLALEARMAGARYFQVRPALADHWSAQPDIACPTWLLEQATSDFHIELTAYKWTDCTMAHGYPLCHGHRLVPFIWADGSVATCGYHFGNAAFTFGTLWENSFAEIWDGDKRRRMLDQGIRVIDTCQHCCKQHEANKALARLRGELATNHAEFV